MDPSKDLLGKRVIIGLSGGVDSAVAALLLKQRGADVQALHMTNWEDDDGYCTAAEELQDARQVCDDLQIPLHHVNFAQEYRDRVFDYFLDEYRAGRTPNPDVLCNREIKFGVFREHAKRLGGDLLATGHYARVIINDGKAELHKAKDGNKDQSYFLHAVSAEALAETVFPLGELVKDEVRELARVNGLSNHDKKDSTGICFIGERPFREFLATFLPANPGPIKTSTGKIIGEHLGLMYYPLGQRQGLGVGGRQDAGGEPWYVAAKQLQDNALIVVQGEDPMLYSNELEASQASWIGDAPKALLEKDILSCQVKIRYRQADQGCSVQAMTNEQLKVSFTEPQRAVAPGQYAVFYDGDRCLGGAVIDKAVSQPTALLAAI
jgi:tRNA-specific 2-thiouridylase